MSSNRKLSDEKILERARKGIRLTEYQQKRIAKIVDELWELANVSGHATDKWPRLIELGQRTGHYKSP